MRHLAEAGVSRRPNVRKLTDDHAAEAARLYATGLSLANVAEHFDVGADTIRRELTAAGIALRPRRGWIG